MGTLEGKYTSKKQQTTWKAHNGNTSRTQLLDIDM